MLYLSASTCSRTHAFSSVSSMHIYVFRVLCICKNVVYLFIYINQKERKKHMHKSTYTFMFI